jgi:hypothetical protein
MTTNLQIKTYKDPTSLKVKESNLIVNNNSNYSASALINHKVRCKDVIGNSLKQSSLTCLLPFSKNTTPREPVSMSFAVDQWFRILLVHMQKQNISLLDNLAVPFEAKTGIINI